MISFSANYLWLFFAYGVGSAFGWYIGNKKKTEDVVMHVIDDLIEQEYIKVRRKENDEVELLKHWEEL
jgi:hypothetical protein